ncbi:MAG: hypothetical protein ACI9NY_000438 [Kiritimatiellia bacterium]|jgi:hypothetical protein
MHKICKLFFIFYCAYSTGATLSYKQLSTDTFQLILKNDTPLGIEQAQSSLYSSAVKICKGKMPAFEKYSFESSEPISKGVSTASFTFQQEIKCTDKTEATPTLTKLDVSKSQEEAIKSKVREMTAQFLIAKEVGKLKEAYDMLGEGMKSMTDFPSWESKESNYFGEKSGKLVSREIWRITLYNNPQNAPKSGLYIAADYENS